jgi:hypothetical protein
MHAYDHIGECSYIYIYLYCISQRKKTSTHEVAGLFARLHPCDAGVVSRNFVKKIPRLPFASARARTNFPLASPPPHLPLPRNLTANYNRSKD